MHEDMIPICSDKVGLPFLVHLTGISYCDGSYKIDRPVSNIYCFEYILKGTGTVCVDDERFSASEGDIYILPAGKNHLYYSDAEHPWEKIWFNISGDLVPALLHAYHIASVHHLQGLDLSKQFLAFVDTAHLPLPTEELLDRLAVIFTEIVQKISAHLRTDAESAVSDLAKAIKAALDGTTDLAEMPDYMAHIPCTKTHAVRLFKEAYGTTPYRYFSERKLSVGKMLLSDTRLSVKEIAAKLGFEDGQYFSVFFKKHTGLSPRAYREKL